MAGLEALSNFLGNVELESLSAEIREKIENAFGTKKLELEEFQIKYERLRVNSEQQYFELEKKLINSNTQLDSVTETKKDLETRFTDLDSKYDECSAKLKALESSHQGSQNNQTHLENVQKQLEADKRELNFVLEKRNKEIATLNDELKALGDKVAGLNREKCETQAKLGEVQSQDVSREYRAKRLTQENAHLQQQIDWLNTELKSKTNDLINVKKDKASRLLEVQSKFDEKTEELSHLQLTHEALKKAKDDQNERIETLIQKLRDARDAQTQSDEQFRQEAAAQAKLVHLYKTSSEESEIKVTELTRAVEELQKLLKEASDAHNKLEQEQDTVADGFREQLTVKDVKIGKLEQELKNANELLMVFKSKGASHMSTEAIEALSPSAAATSKILKSGMSLTQIYNEYVVASENLEVEKEENKRLNQYLDQILQEIEERAPLMKKQREDYETSLQTISQLTSQLDTAMLDSEKLRREGDESRRKFGHFQRESQKFQQQTIDLGQQVRYLVKEVEELRGGRVVRDEHVSSSDISSSSGLISEKLVTFKNIEELQDQNQRLLEVVRELSDKKEEEEKHATDTKTRELQEQLDLAQGELEELRSAKTRQAEMVESIVRQRDMYRVLLQQGGGSMPAAIPPMMASTPRPGFGLQTPRGPSPRGQTPRGPMGSGNTQQIEKMLEESRTALKELQAEFTTYKKERGENERMISVQLDKTRQELSEMRVQNAKLASQLDFSAERYKVLQGNVEGYRKEIAALTDKNQQYATSVVKHEQTINMLREDLMASQESQTRLDVQNDNLRAELNLAKSSEQRLEQELQSVRREQMSQNLLLSNLEAIQNNLERAESETKMRLNNQMSAYEREVNSLKRRLEVQSEEHRTLTRNWESLVKNIQIEMDREKKSHSDAKTRFDDANKNVAELKQQLSATEAKLVVAENKLSRLGPSITLPSERSEPASTPSSTPSDSSEEVKDLKSEINQLQQQLKALKSQLETSKKHGDQYKAIADSVEETLKEQNKTSKEFQQTLEQRSVDLKTSKEQLEKRLETMEKERQDLLNENIRISEESHSLNADLRKQLVSLQNELQEAVERREAAIMNEETAKRDYHQQAEIAMDSQKKYERELVLHAADVETLTKYKKDVEEFNDTLSLSQDSAKKADQTLKEAQTSWWEQEKILREEANMLDKRVQELTKQNTMLHEQMEKLSGQVTNIQRKASADSAGRLVGEDVAKSSDQLLEVIRFLRRDKEIAETKLEMSKAECVRVNQRYSHLEKQLTDTNKMLTEERSQGQVSVQTAAQHADLMRKVENMNVLTDSNKLLREERDKLQQQLHTLEAKLKKAEGDLTPLQANIRSLQAQKDAAATEKTALQSEVERWKGRTNHLIEQANKSDPEEHRRTVVERDNLKRQLSQVNEERHKHRAEVSRLNSNLQQSQTEVNNAKTQITQLNVQIAGVKKQLEEKSQDGEEKVKTINQLKKIGRKYKEQAENIGKELEQANKEMAEVKAKSASQEAAQPNMAAIEQASAELREKLAGAESQRDEAKTQLQQKDGEIAEMKARLEAVTREHTQLQEATTKLREENSEYEKKQNHSRTVLQTAKNKLTNQREQMERLTEENNELKKRINTSEGSNREEQDLRMGTLKSQYEGRINRLEKELQEARAGLTPNVADMQQQLDRLRGENTELQARIQALQKQLESQQKHIAQPASIVTRPAATTPPSTSTSDQTPKMANIKPLATSTTSVGQATPMPHSVAAAKATASIRPMAIAPTSAPSTSTATPTATVMPTTVTSQDVGDDDHSSSSTTTGPSSSLPSASVAGRPQQVQIVTPQVEQTQQDMSSDLVEESSPVILEPLVTQQPQTAQVTSVTPHMAMPSTSSGAVGGDVPQSLGKRQREEHDSQEEAEMQAKRTRTTQGSPLPVIMVTDENAQTVNIEPQEVLSQQQMSMSQGETSAEGQFETVTVPPHMTGQMGADGMTTLDQISQQPPADLFEGGVEVATEMGDDDNGDVIVVGSDEDQEGGQEDSNEEEYEDEGDEDYEEEEDDEDGMTGEGEEEEEEEEEDNDVVIIDIDDNDPVVPPQQPVVPTGPGPVIQQPIISQQPVGQPGPFEEEDCTVPSTPTLSVPRRADGFAEALNSPQVSQRFVFGGDGGLNQPDMAQLETQRGMDDTRMDLSQLDDGGRSVPTTPLQTTPPASLSDSVVEMARQVPPPDVLQSASDVVDTEVAVETTETEQETEEIEESALLEGDLSQESTPTTGDGKPEGETEGGEEDGASASQSSEGISGTLRSALRKRAGGPKTRIQRIIWDAERATTSPPASAPPPQPAPTPTPTSSQPVRGHQSAFRSRGFQPRGMRRGGAGMRPMRGPGGWRGQPRGGQQPRGRPMRGNYRGGQY